MLSSNTCYCYWYLNPKYWLRFGVAGGVDFEVSNVTALYKSTLTYLLAYLLTYLNPDNWYLYWYLNPKYWYWYCRLNPKYSYSTGT